MLSYVNHVKKNLDPKATSSINSTSSYSMLMLELRNAKFLENGYTNGSQNLNIEKEFHLVVVL